MEHLNKQFENRNELIAYVRSIAPWAKGDHSPIEGGFEKAETLLAAIEPIAYANSRNYGNGKITGLSPYIHYGIISLNEVRNHALEKCSAPIQITKFLQELGWRDFWQRMLTDNPDAAWHDIEAYKTGFTASEYSDVLSQDILDGTTNEACINAFIHELTTTGYIHNHARMYLASYIVHFRRIKWQAGARWFLHHLLDGDTASNNLSWQWVASTFSHKPYIFNLENVDKYFGKLVDTSPENNRMLDNSYERLHEMLFPTVARF